MKQKRIYRKGIPHKLVSVNTCDGCIGHVEVPIIKTLAGLMRYIERFDIDESEVLDAFNAQNTINHQIQLRRDYYHKMMREITS